MQPRELAAALRTHPLVVDARVAQDGDVTVAYVVPVTDEALAARLHVEGWRRVFDVVRQPEAEDLTVDAPEWVSSYDGTPIPRADMREWTDTTVARITALRPRRMLDVGCGAGLLLHRLGPLVEHYTGLEISSVALARARQLVADQGLPARLVEGRADELAQFAPRSVDTVVLNSVVQYFPSQAYLLDALGQAVELVRPGGFVFVGDVRSLPLLGTFHLSVALARTDPERPFVDAQARAAKRQAREEELVVDPRLFTQLVQRLPRVMSAAVWPRRGRGTNEMVRFRYDAVLSVEPDGRPLAPARWLDWAEVGSMETLRKLLDELPAPFGIHDIPNPLTDSSWTAHLASDASVADGRAAAAAALAGPTTPEVVTSTHPSVQVSWARGAKDGSFDAVVLPADHSGAPVAFPTGVADELSNDPLARTSAGMAHRDLVRRLCEHLAGIWPSAETFPDIVPVAELPGSADSR